LLKLSALLVVVRRPSSAVFVSWTSPMSGFDYSKWDRLEISDDEETHHPNLDKNLNIRVNRITRDRKEEEIDTQKKDLIAAGQFDKAEKLEDKRPLHAGNLCHVAEERTIINRSTGHTSDRLKKGEESFSVDDYTQFKMDNQALLDEFSNADWEKSKDLLHRRGDVLMQEYSNSYFMLNCLDEQMKGNVKRAQQLGKQGQIISQIFQLAEPMKRPPRDLVPRFFERFDHDTSRAAFQEGVDHFMKHIENRAIEKKKEQEEEAAQEAAAAAEQPPEEEMQAVPLIEAMYTMTEEERKGPGGLDPVEVFESLPVEMQNCFKSGDIEKLKEVSRTMEPQEFETHFKRCIDAGLWSSG
jgi:cell division cycle protein 37